MPHRDFRIFACMNPPTDVGKKELPPGLRNRFTEFYVAEISREADLRLVVQQYLGALTSSPPVKEIVEFYTKVKAIAPDLGDGGGHAPHFSLRTLCRALEFVTLVVNDYGLSRSLFEGISMTFLTQLDGPSTAVMTKLIASHFLSG